jgi:hypothetical protein
MNNKARATLHSLWASSLLSTKFHKDGLANELPNIEQLLVQITEFKSPAGHYGPFSAFFHISIPSGEL